jgi:hypothetical protein
MKQAVGAGAGASGGDRRPRDKSDSVGDDAGGDAGGGGGIDDLCGGFAAMMCGGDTRGYGSKREALEKAFDKYDENKDGYLTQGELTTWLNAVFDMSYRKDTGLRARIGTDPLSLARATAEVRRGATRVEVWRRGAALKAKRVAVGAARPTSGAWAKRRVCEAARVCEVSRSDPLCPSHVNTVHVFASSCVFVCFHVCSSSCVCLSYVCVCVCVFVVCLQDAFETSLLSLAGEIDKPELYRWMMRDQSSPDPQKGSKASGGGGGGDGRGRGRGRDRSRSRSRSRSREDRERDHRHSTFGAPAATGGGLSFDSAPAASQYDRGNG